MIKEIAKISVIIFLVVFNFSKFIFSFRPGDVVMIQPENVTLFVDKFIALLNLNPEKRLRVTISDTGRTIE